ncbi:hypothetical protein [Streptomyces sp. NPDC049040]|uniref:hypothetical protein n=1 Tax=Streptomyces sp. NPDC049040 TaxID=3365593 RepID=UPI003719F90B
MSHRAGRRIGRGPAVVAFVLAAAGAGLLAVHDRASAAPPHVDPALGREVRPVVDRYVLTAAAGPLGSARPAEPGGNAPRAFCTERVIEIRPAGSAVRVGLVAWCGHYVRDGDGVSAVDAGISAGVLTVSPASAPARVTGASWEPDDRLSTWAPAHFSPEGTSEVERVLGDSAAHLDDPVALARTAFGVGAPAR